ncbi:MAG TPA: hypothetical protein VGN01_11190 [Acidobacteriaceae bacterium]
MTKPVPDTPTAEQQRLLVERILASVLFRKSHKLASFLKFICEQQQLGKADTINEQRIGTEVFGRSEGYHMGDDSIVRSQARFLRLRLQEYFTTEGRTEPIVLTIPKGSYVPEFQYREASKELEPAAASVPQVPEAVPKAAPAAVETIKVEGHSRFRLLWMIVAAVVCLAAAFGWIARQKGNAHNVAPVEVRFWASIFDPQRTAIIVPADSSLIIMEEMSGKQVDPADYMSRKYLYDPPPPGMGTVWNALRSSQYTSIADVNFVSRLERIPEAAQGKIQIRSARDVSLKALKESNAIMIGGSRSDPWIGLFDSLGHFRVDYDAQAHINFVHNKMPGPGEQERYDEIGEGEGHLAYGAIAYLPSLDGEGSALLVGGTSKAGTEAAADFLFNSQFAAFLRGIDTGGAIPRFEILLSTQNLNGDSYHGTIVCFHRLTDAGR